MNLGGWGNFAFGGETHVMPLGDLREHDPAGCWCGPCPDAECPAVILHRSMDGREAFEEGDRLLS